MCKGLSIDDVGVSRDPAFQEIRPGAGLETGDFVKETLGGLTVERLHAEHKKDWSKSATSVAARAIRCLYAYTTGLLIGLCTSKFFEQR